MAHQTIWWRACFMLSVVTIAVMLPALAMGQAESPAEQAAPEEGPSEEELAMVQWTARYRLGTDLEEGDWVKYEMIVGPERTEIEIRVTGVEDRGTWITETYHQEGGSSEIHLLVDLTSMRLVDGFYVAPDGTRQTAELLPEERVDEIVEKQVAVGLPEMPMIGFAACAENEITGDFGSLVCGCLEPVYREEFVSAWTGDQLEQMLDPMRMYLSEDVPRLWPMQAVTPWALLAPEDFRALEGGLVRNQHMTLSAYSKERP